MLKRTFLQTHSSYSKETAQLEIWVFVILHLPTPIAHLGTVIRHFFNAFKNNPRTMVVQAFDGVVPKILSGFTSDKFILRFNTKQAYFEVIGIFLDSLYSWTNDIQEPSKMESSTSGLTVYKHIFPIMVKIFFKTIPLFEDFKAFYDLTEYQDQSLNRAHVFILFEKLEPICRLFSLQKMSRYHDILNEANERLVKERSERLTSSQLL
jgi:hypothetical protein